MARFVQYDRRSSRPGGSLWSGRRNMVRDARREAIVRIFLAGASGSIGVPLAKALVEAGYKVVALTRSPDKQEMLRTIGARPVVADALDALALQNAVEAARPTH